MHWSGMYVLVLLKDYATARAPAFGRCWMARIMRIVRSSSLSHRRPSHRVYKGKESEARIQQQIPIYKQQLTTNNKPTHKNVYYHPRPRTRNPSPHRVRPIRRDSALRSCLSRRLQCRLRQLLRAELEGHHLQRADAHARRVQVEDPEPAAARDASVVRHVRRGRYGFD